MGYSDKLVRRKNGSYVLKSKTKKAKIEEHLTMHPKHKSVTPDWCDDCKVLKKYIVRVGYE